MNGENIYDYIRKNKPLLVKVTKKIYAEDFIKGRLYLNPIQFFQSIEDSGKEMKRDSYEGATYAIQSTEFDYLVSPNDPDVKIPAASIIGAVWKGFNQTENHKILCLYNIDIDFENLTISPIDKRLSDFGDTFILIKDTFEFIRRLESGIEKISSKLNGPGVFRAVEYIDALKYSGEVGPFRKVNSYRWQNEYRICLKFKEDITGPYTLDIGDISDICIIGKTESLLQGIKFQDENKLYIPL